MSVAFDIETAAEAILAEGELAACKGLLAAHNTFEAGASNGVLQSDMPSGATIRGERSMVIQGSLNGIEGNPCRVQVKGDLVVTGHIYFAQIHCRKLYVDGDIDNSRIIAVEDIHIGGKLINSQLSTGDYSDRKRFIEDCHRDYERGQEDRESLERQIRQEEKRVDRSCKATRIPLDFNVSRIMTHENHQVRINLSNFYSSLGDLPDSKRKSALMEFFAKGVVGHLARANRKYIGDNPAREKIFLQLLKHLRALFLIVSERDFLVRRQQLEQEKIAQIVKELRKQECTIYVRGGIAPETSLRFVLPRVRKLADSEFEFIDGAATLKVSAGKSGNVQLEHCDTKGNKESRDLAASELEELHFQTTQGKVVWSTAVSAV